MMTDEEQPEIFIYHNPKTGGVEVKLTGRTAERRSTSGKNAIQIHEITPSDSANGTWTKWVMMKELFKLV